MNIERSTGFHPVPFAQFTRTRPEREGRKMSDTEDKKPPPSKRQQRQATDAVQIYTTPPTSEDVVFLARELILCTLPHSDPGDVLMWSRTNGNLTLAIKAGVNEKTGKSYGVPYGIIPRLFWFGWLQKSSAQKAAALSLDITLKRFSGKTWFE